MKKTQNIDTHNPYEPIEKGLPLFQNVRQTSLEAYQDIKETGKKGSQTQKIYNLLLENQSIGGMSLQEISKLSGIAINAVCGRINELKKQNEVVECEKRRCRITNRTIIPLRAKLGD